MKSILRNVAGASVGAVTYAVVVGFLNNEVRSGIDLVETAIAALFGGASGGLIYGWLSKADDPLNPKSKMKRILATAFAFGIGVAIYMVSKHIFDHNYLTNGVFKPAAVGFISGFVGGFVYGLISVNAYYLKLAGKRQKA